VPTVNRQLGQLVRNSEQRVPNRRRRLEDVKSRFCDRFRAADLLDGGGWVMACLFRVWDRRKRVEWQEGLAGIGNGGAVNQGSEETMAVGIARPSVYARAAHRSGRAQRVRDAVRLLWRRRAAGVGMDAGGAALRHSDRHFAGPLRAPYPTETQEDGACERGEEKRGRKGNRSGRGGKRKSRERHHRLSQAAAAVRA
jgi:hypothetical protein